MTQVADSNSTCSERAELEVMLSALARNPRLAKLLKFVAERALQGKTEEINEYTIATEVFDRSKTTFDGSTDSIARVETFRLRKKLKEYYETEGKDHAVVISLPGRSYVPEFTRRDVSLQLSAPAPIPQANELRDSSFVELGGEGSKHLAEAAFKMTRHTGPNNRRKQILLYGAIAIILVFLLILGAFRLVLRIRSAQSENTAAVNPVGTVRVTSATGGLRVALDVSELFGSLPEPWQAIAAKIITYMNLATYCFIISVLKGQ